MIYTRRHVVRSVEVYQISHRIRAIDLALPPLAISTYLWYLKYKE